MGLEQELTDPDAVWSAMSEFDRLGRAAFLDKYGFGRAYKYWIQHEGRRYDAKAIIGAARGFQYPDRGPLRSEEFSSSERAVKDLLERVGFEIDAKSDSPPMTGGLSVLLTEVLTELSLRTPGKDQTFKGAALLRELIESAIPKQIQAIVGAAGEARGSIGMGMIADVPWVGVFGPAGDSSAKSGYYPVYLFATDGSSVYLSLNQGTEDIPGGTAPLKKRAWELRAAAGTQPQLTTEMDLHSKNSRPRMYQAGNAYAFEYHQGAIPDDKALVVDLQHMLFIMSEVEKKKLVFNPKLEPLHLLFKWNDSIEANTIALHRTIAIAKGSVWWGRFGPGPAGMSAKRITELQHQLDEGVPTHVYLYRRGEIWRSTLQEITSDPELVDEERLPTYYAKEDCNLFVRIDHFENLPADWTPGHLVPANTGDPEKLAGALSNQTTPLFVFETGVTVDTQSTPLPVDDPTVEVSIEWLMDQSLLDVETLQEITEALTDDSPQVILAGPPGTGKTWVARALARYLTNDAPLAYRIVQFHPSYGYEEFVEGLRPVAEDGGIAFRRVDGVVLDMVKSLTSPEDQVVLIIDEMNRANLPRVFGEFLSLLEYRDTPMNLLYTKDFELPSGLMVIGTMNTADRSIRSIDSALRRRFDIFEFSPSPGILERFFETNDNQVPDLIEGFTNLNAKLESLLGRHYLIGHTFFMRSIFTPALLRLVWIHQVFPLIEEYFFDQPDIAGQFILEEIWPSLAN